MGVTQLESQKDLTVLSANEALSSLRNTSTVIYKTDETIVVKIKNQIKEIDSLDKRMDKLIDSTNSKELGITKN